jgi:Holliday junction DNA helicase RuvA
LRQGKDLRNGKLRLHCVNTVEHRNFLWNGKEKCIFIGAAPGGKTGGLPYNTPRYNTQMIAHLRGTLLAKRPNQAIVETHGVGYDVSISVPTFTEMPAAGADVALHIHTHVREDALSLYGFLRLAEKQLFEKLLTVSGIGPTLAIKILSGMPADEMVGAIRRGDLARLTRIPGIGRKTAERMVLELRDKLPAAGTSEMSTPQASPVEEDVISALVNLGYPRAAAEKAFLAARSGKSPQSFDTLFREALGSLSK